MSGTAEEDEVFCFDVGLRDLLIKLHCRNDLEAPTPLPEPSRGLALDDPSFERVLRLSPYDDQKRIADSVLNRSFESESL